MIDTQKDIRITERNPSKSQLPRITYIEISKNLLKSNNRLDYLPAYPRSRNSLQNVTLSKYQAPEVLAFWLVTICWYMRQTVKKSKAAARERRQDESKNAKTGEKETARGEQEKENEKNSDEREAGKKKGLVGKSGTRQEKGNCGTETPEKAIAKNKSQAGKTVRKGNGAKAEIRRALSSHQYKGDVRLWLLEEHLTSEAFDIHRLPPGIISKLADGRCWRGEGAGFPGELCVFGSRRDVVRIVCVEVGGNAKTTNVIALATFPVKDHSKYKSYLNKLRRSPNTLRATIFSCYTAWEEDSTAELVNGLHAYETLVMGRKEKAEAEAEVVRVDNLDEWECHLND